MSLLLAFALLQAPAADKPVEEHVAAFLRGKAPARAELLRLGPYAVLPLEKVLEKAPAKVNPLLRELKQAAAYPVPVRFDLDFRGSLSVDPGPIDYFNLKVVGIPVFLDGFDPAKLKTRKFGLIDAKGALDAIESICEQTGLDYAYHHHHVVFSMPERLWPAGPPPKWPALAGDDLKKAKALVERLKEKDAQAQNDLLKMGGAVVPLLETHLKSKEPEIAARCAALLLRLRPRAGAFGPAAAALQELDEKSRAVVKILDRPLPGSSWHENLALERIALNFEKQHGLKFDLRGHAARRVSIGLTGRLFDFLSLMTQTLDLDFAVVEGVVVIDSPDAIWKLIGGP